MASKPTQRSLKYLRDKGWPLVQVVEKWIPQAKRHQDLFGFADILAMHPRRGHLYVQTTSYSNVSARVKKIREIEAAGIVLEAPRSRIEVHGWHKVKNRWVPRIVDVSMEIYYDMNNEEWDAIWQLMRQVNEAVVREYTDGIFQGKALIENYPPRIVIYVNQTKVGGNNRTKGLSTKELNTVSEIAIRMTEQAMEQYPWLVLSNHYYDSEFGRAYKLKPRDYEEVAKIGMSMIK